MKRVTIIFILTLGIAVRSEIAAPRRMCPGKIAYSYQCSEDSREYGYCDGTNWISLGECSAGLICVNDPLRCVIGTGNSPSASVECSVDGLKVPNLEDSTCRTYYKCSVSQGAIIGYGVIQHCPAGTFFDACSGQCNAVSCWITTPEECNIATDWTLLQTNNRLAYTCRPPIGGFRTILWKNCPNGYVADPIMGCAEDLSNSCVDGAGICPTADRHPIPGTNCQYLQCYDDSSFSVKNCAIGYHYDDSVKLCVIGPCS